MRSKIFSITSILLEISLLAIIFLLPVYFSFFQENYNAFELVKIIIFRVLLTVAIICLAVEILFDKDYKIKIFKVFIPLSILAGSFIVSTLMSIHPELSLWGNYYRQQGLYTYLSYLIFFSVLLFYLLCPAEKKKQRINKVLWTLVYSSALVCLYGFAQYFCFDPLNWIETRPFVNRIFSTFGQPNFFGHYLVIVIPVTVYAIFYLTKKIVPRFLLVLLLFAQIFCLTFTYSRSAWLGFLGSIFVGIALYLWMKRKYKLLIFLAGSTIAIFAVCFCLASYYSKHPIVLEPATINFSERFKSAFDFNGGSNRIRLYYWQAALSEFGEANVVRKFFGFGPDALLNNFSKYYQSHWGIFEVLNNFPDRSHNSILDILLQFGIFGLLAIFFFLLYILIPALKKMREGNDEEKWLCFFLFCALIAYFFNNLFSFSTVTTYVYLYLYLAFLYAVATSEYSLSENNKVFSLSPILKFSLLASFLFIAAVLIIYYNVNFYLADKYYMKVKRAEAGKNCRDVFDSIEKVLNLDQVSTFYKAEYIHFSLNCFDTLDSQKSRNDWKYNIDNVIASIPVKEYEYYTRANLANANSFFGYYFNPVYYKTAEEIYNSLIELNPDMTTPYQDLGRIKLWQKDYAGAIIEFQKSMKALPDENDKYLNNDHRKKIESEKGKIYDLIGTAYYYEKKIDPALENLKLALKYEGSFPEIYKKIADLYYQKGDVDSAIRYNERGYMLQNNEVSWLLSLALLNKEKGNLRLAKNYADQVLALDKNNQIAKQILNEQ